MKHLLPDVKRYFKTNLHTHSTKSDGRHTPEEVKEIYKSRGYQILALTDHEKFIPHPELNDNDFLALNSYELSINEAKPNKKGKCYHFNLISKNEENPLQFSVPAEAGQIWESEEKQLLFTYPKERQYSVEYANRFIAAANKMGFLVTYNHPTWSQQEHPDYIAVAHNCIVVDHDSSRKDEVYPQCTDEEYTFDHFAKDIMPGQLTTVMLRNVYHDDRYDTSLLNRRIVPGDRLIYFWLLSNGKIHCIQEEMSAYRHVTNQGSSFSATAKYHFATYETLYAIFMEYAREQNHKEALLCAERLYFRNLRVGSVFGQCSLKDSLRYFRKIRNKAKVLLLYIPTMLESRKQS